MNISVIIPVYNGEAVLENTVNSVLNSGLADFEILLVDDGSRDNTPAVCERLTAAHQNIRCIRQENAGVSAARNRGLEEAVGEYILFFDDDDSVGEGSLAEARELLNREKPDMLVFGMRFDYCFRGRIYRREEPVYPGEICYESFGWAAHLEALFKANMLSSSCNRFIRSKLLRDNGLAFDPSLRIYEDLLFVLNALRFSPKVYMLPKPLYRYRNDQEQNKGAERLKGISLTAFMEPFRQALGALEESTAFAEGDKLLCDLYAMLLQQQLYGASKEQMEKASLDMLAGSYGPALRERAPALYGDLAKGRFRKLACKSRLLMLKRSLAVRVKYLLSFRRPYEH